MSAEERVSVKTSVPRYQKETWTDHAEALDMTQSEFVRTMVQAGRRGFEPDPPETGSPDANPRGNALRTPVLEALSSDEHREFGEIVDSVAEELDELVESTVDALAEEGHVEISARRGVRLTEATDGGD